MTLTQKQYVFSVNVARLILWCNEHGYGVALGEALRTPEQAAINAGKGIGIANSLHMVSLAIDLKLFNGMTGSYLTRSEDYAGPGGHWKSLHNDNRWGGDFSKPDGDHFSMENDGVQ